MNLAISTSLNEKNELAIYKLTHFFGSEIPVMNHSGWYDYQVVMVTGGTVVQPGVVTEPRHNRGGVEGNVTLSTSEVLVSQALLRIHFQNEIWSFFVF